MARKYANNYAFNKIGNENLTNEVATTTGIGIKTIILVAITLISALATMAFIHPTSAIGLIVYIVVGVINFILHFIIAFRPLTAQKLAIPYAIMEGMLLGVISGLVGYALKDYFLPGLALVITVAMFLASAILYTTGVIKVGNIFRKFLFSFVIGTVAISFLFGLIALILFLVNGTNLFAMYYASPLAIIISVVMIIISALYVVLSLDNANQIVESGSDKAYEWLASYGILINIVWMYLEVLRLLILIVSRRD